MSDTLVLQRGRLNTFTCSLGVDITGDTITSEIRERDDQSSALIKTVGVTVEDASNGDLTFTVDDQDNGVAVSKGFWDIKRTSGGDELPVFDAPVVVEFRGTVTA